MLGGFAYAAPAPCLYPTTYPNMNKERKDRARQVKAYHRMQSARRQAEYWRRRWESHPETMRSNLDRINGTRREKAAERTQRLLRILGHCTQEIKSWELRPTLNAAIGLAGYPVKPNSFNVFFCAARRRGLLTYSPDKMAWMVSLA